MTFVAIEGVIGVGKTTLARFLQADLNATLVLEVFEENPFLSAFYQDRDRYAFQTQMFFLLSRYHQLRELAKMPHPIISDYMFAKDWLFAHLNVRGDELEMYERVHAALAESTPHPDLVVFLQADTTVLMNRIAQRDRPYERGMDEDYIDRLRIAYEQFFANYSASALITIDTNDLNIILNESDRSEVLQQIRDAVGQGPRQPSLPGLERAVPEEAPQPLNPHISPRRLTDFQQFHRALDREKGFSSDLLFNFMLMQEEIGELAKAIKKQWLLQQAGQVFSKDDIQEELADVLAYVLKLANYTGIDLEAAYLDKMAINRERTWSLPEG